LPRPIHLGRNSPPSQLASYRHEPLSTAPLLAASEPARRPSLRNCHSRLCDCRAFAGTELLRLSELEQQAGLEEFPGGFETKRSTADSFVAVARIRARRRELRPLARFSKLAQQDQPRSHKLVRPDELGRAASQRCAGQYLPHGLDASNAF